MIAWAIFRNSLPLQLMALAVAGWVALMGNNAIQRSRGASDAVSTINTQTQELAREATEARRPADTPGAFERLRTKFCGDCAGVRTN